MTSPLTLIDIDRQKRAAAEAAVAEIEPGMLVGIGTGSTVAFAIAALAQRCATGLRVRTVVTSERSGIAARAAGLEVIDFAGVERIDLAIDGVDEIDPAFRAIKGAGGAMLREKIVASAADRMIAIADGGKAVDRLGAAPVPVEILPFAQAFVARAVREAGGVPVLRRIGNEAYHTDQQNLVLDCGFGPITDPAALAAALAAVPGVVGHGLFLTEIDALYLGTERGVIKSARPHRYETN